MKPGTGIRMPGGDRFVQLDPQAGSGRWNDVSFLPANRLFENLRLKTVPGLNALLNQEIRAAGVNLNVGGPLDRPTIQMGAVIWPWVPKRGGFSTTNVFKSVIFMIANSLMIEQVDTTNP